jgi:hypothetical protein
MSDHPDGPCHVRDCHLHVRKPLSHDPEPPPNPDVRTTLR